MTNNIKFIGLATAALLLAASLRLVGLDAHSLWFDEGWSAYAAAQPSLWQAANADSTNPPLYYSLLHVNAILTGDSVFSLRWFSFAAGMLALALSIRLAARVSGRRAGLLAGLLGAINLPLVWAAGEMRMYTLLAVLVLVLALAWERLRTRPTRGAWAALLLAELAALYTHNTGPVIVLWLNAVTLLAWLVHRKPPLLAWLGGQVIVGLLWLPYFISRFVQVAGANSALVRRTPLSFDIWAALWVAPWERVSGFPAWAVLPLALVLLLLPRWERPAVRWLGAHALLLTAGLLAALAVLGNEFHGRYVVMIVPLVLALASDGIARFSRPVMGVLLLPFLLVTAAGWGLLAGRSDDARAMVQHYAKTLTSEDTVLAWSYADRYDLAYYWDRLDVAAERVTLPEGADLPEVLPRLPEDGAISVNVWYTQRADYRGMLSCVLGHGTAQPPDLYEVSGMATLTYDDPALNLPDLRPVNAPFEVATVTAVGAPPVAFTAHQGVCLPVQITLHQPTPAELKAALVVTNPLGQEITRADAVFATPNQRTSIDGTAGETLTAYPLVRLPHGAPPADYTLSLRLYDETALSGYDLLQGGAPAGKDWQLGTWQPEPGATWDTDNNPDGLRLVRGAGEIDAYNGERVTVTLLWEGDPNTPLPMLTLRGAGWSVDVPPLVTEHDNAVLDWRAFRVPPEAKAGTAALVTPDDTQAAQIVVSERAITYDAPPTDYTTSAVFPGVGEIVGYDVTFTDEAAEVTLVWRAAEDAASTTDYTAFVQLLDENGQLAAQSDAIARPTTGWRPSEIIIDQHTLPFQQDVDQAQLIAGLYDPGGQRVRLPDGSNYAILNNSMAVP